MKRSLLGLALAVALPFAAANAAEGISWNYVEGGYAATSSDRIASITIVADTHEELVEKHNKAASVIKIIDENGKDMMRHDLLTDIK